MIGWLAISLVISNRVLAETATAPSVCESITGIAALTMFSLSLPVISSVSPVTLSRKLSRICMVFLALITLLTA